MLPKEESKFREMLEQHGKEFAFSPQEIRRVDPKLVEPMVIFTIPHVPWNLKPIPVPRAHIPKLLELLKENIRMGILYPSNAPYSSRWFTVPKKNGALRFIQDFQPVNKVTIRNVAIGPSVDEFVLVTMLSHNRVLGLIAHRKRERHAERRVHKMFYVENPNVGKTTTVHRL